MTKLEFIKFVAEIAVEDWKARRIMLPSVVIAQACKESTFGTSELALNARAIFGIKLNGWTGKSYRKKADEQNPDGSFRTDPGALWRAYDDWRESIIDHNTYIAERKVGKQSEPNFKAIIGETNVKKVIAGFVGNENRIETAERCTDPELKRYVLEGKSVYPYATGLNYPQSLYDDYIVKYDLTKYDVVEEVNSMSYTFKTNIANKANYGSARNTSKIKYIVIHYTANDGDTDENNGKYFKNNIVKASAHYFVDDDSVTQSVPDNYTAYSVGGKKYSNTATTGGGSFYGKCTNSNSISVELCDDFKNGVIYPSAKTIENALELVRFLMSKYNIPASNVIRHFDVTGKSCPAYWVDGAKWKSEFHNKLTGAVKEETPKVETVKELYRVRKTWADSKSQIGAYSVLASAKLQADRNPGYKVFNTSGARIYPVDTEETFKVRVSIGDLNIRAGNSTDFKKVGICAPGVYTIVDVKEGKGSRSGWGKLKSGTGWISLDYAQRV